MPARGRRGAGGHRLRSVVLAVVVAAGAGGNLSYGVVAAHAEGVPENGTAAFSLRGRFVSQWNARRNASDGIVDFVSGSPIDTTRLMVDGRLGWRGAWSAYAKVTARWNAPRDESEKVPLEFRQADVRWGSGSSGSAAVLFYNERRFFTSEPGLRLLDDDTVGSSARVYGVRGDLSPGPVQMLAIASALEDSSGSVRPIAFVRGVVGGGGVQSGVTWVADVPANASADAMYTAAADISFLRGPVATTVSYAQRAPRPLAGRSLNRHRPGDRDALGILPDASLLSGELRARELFHVRSVRGDVVARYRRAGASWNNDLGRTTPGRIDRFAGVWLRHVALALDGRVEYHRSTSWAPDDRDRERLEASLDAQFDGGGEVFARAVLETRRQTGANVRNNFLHVGYRWNADTWTAGVAAYTATGPVRARDVRWATNVRFRVGARTAIAGRLVQRRVAVSGDAAWVRLEFRPSPWLYAALGWGRADRGNGPRALEDPGVDPPARVEPVYSLSIRGDF